MSLGGAVLTYSGITACRNTWEYRTQTKYYHVFKPSDLRRWFSSYQILPVHVATGYPALLGIVWHRGIAQILASNSLIGIEIWRTQKRMSRTLAWADRKVETLIAHYSVSAAWHRCDCGYQTSCRPFFVFFCEFTSFGDHDHHIWLSWKQTASLVVLFELFAAFWRVAWGWPWTITAGSQMGTSQSTALHTTGVCANHGFSRELSAGGCNGPTSMQGFVHIVPGHSNGCIGLQHWTFGHATIC